MEVGRRKRWAAFLLGLGDGESLGRAGGLGNGYGVLVLANGDKREGDWCEGMLLGPGKDRENGQHKKTLH